MLAHNERRPTLHVPLTPLIDVVFIMLLFFMLSSTFVRYQQIGFASASTGSVEQVPDTRSVLVAADGSFDADGQRHVPGTALTDALFADWKRSDANVVVTAHADTPVQTLIRVLDSLRAAGIANLKLSESY
ncbi:ExbD/TolR family protein [Thiosocius teredinicola]|uniref:ExbD/TolR family protein n=1 Tax=Thiosocius teredinicola TaxID=1973002 RepID=UPI0013DDF08F